jgi:predicted Fe-Mo cluster-binding NifX family protein
MRVAIPVWQGRVSPVFDSSRRLLLLELAEGRVRDRRECEIGGELPQDRSRRLLQLGAEVLICGAVSRPLAERVTQAGIRLIPFIAGEVEEILQAYVEDRLPSVEFLMPGCCGERRRAGSGGQCGGPSRNQTDGNQ